MGTVVSDHFTRSCFTSNCWLYPSDQQIDEQYVTADSQDLHFIVLYSKNPVKPHPTPDEPDVPVTPIVPVTPVNPENQLHRQVPEVRLNSRMNHRSPTHQVLLEVHQRKPSETPKSDEPTSSAVPNSEEPVIPEIPTTPTSTVTGINSTPAKAVSAAGESPVNEMPVSEPVTVHAVKGMLHQLLAKHLLNCIPKVTATGNQHQSIWRVTLVRSLDYLGLV